MFFLGHLLFSLSKKKCCWSTPCFTIAAPKCAVKKLWRLRLTLPQSWRLQTRPAPWLGLLAWPSARLSSADVPAGSSSHLCCGLSSWLLEDRLSRAAGDPVMSVLSSPPCNTKSIRGKGTRGNWVLRFPWDSRLCPNPFSHSQDQHWGPVQKLTETVLEA